MSLSSEPKSPPPIIIRSGVSVKDETGLRALGKELQTAIPPRKEFQLGPTPKLPSRIVDMLLDEVEPVAKLAKKMRSLMKEEGLPQSTPKGKPEATPQRNWKICHNATACAVEHDRSKNQDQMGQHPLPSPQQPDYTAKTETTPRQHHNNPNLFSSGNLPGPS